MTPGTKKPPQGRPGAALTAASATVEVTNASAHTAATAEIALRGTMP